MKIKLTGYKNCKMSTTPYILFLPEIALENIFSFLTFDEIAKNRIVCRKFNEIGGKMLTRGFIQLEKRHSVLYKRVKAALPRRESERKNHPLSRHSDILQAVETRISMLSMTYTKYSKLVCFIPGKVLDEMRSVLNLVEGDQTPPRTNQLLQEMRDLSSMAMEHFDEHILPMVKEQLLVKAQLEQKSGSSEKILNDLEVVAGSLLRPYSRYQAFLCGNVPSTSNKYSRMVQQQVQHVLSTELRKVKRQSKNHKHHITYLTQSTHKLCHKLRKQNMRLKAQSIKLREHERKIQEQNTKIQEQEATLADIKKHIDEWDQKYKDLTTELVRARDEILSKATTFQKSPSGASQSVSPKFYKSNIKPRMANIFPKSYLSVDLERKRKSNLLPEIPTKRNKSPCFEEKNKRNTDNIQLNLPDIIDFKENTSKENDNLETQGSYDDIGSIISSSIESLLKSPLAGIKTRKRKMPDDIDLK